MNRGSIIVPVRDEATILTRSVPALLAASEPGIRIIWVCNGCSDQSADVIRSYAGSNAEIIELAQPGKTKAWQAGDDRLGNSFPRLYLDADVLLNPGDVDRLMSPLRMDLVEMTAPSREVDLTRSNRIASSITKCWMDLPHAGLNGAAGAFALSRAGRRRWNIWPELTGDDLFVASVVPMERRLIVSKAIATSRPPSTGLEWLQTWRRWLSGDRELRELGFKPPCRPGQRRALFKKFLRPSSAPGAFLYTVVRLLVVFSSNQDSHHWRPNRAP